METLALILGSGFLCEAELPATSKLFLDELPRVPDTFSHRPDYNGDLEQSINDKITSIILDFWRTVFGYHNDAVRPTLEDHFTVLDLSANSGHYLGSAYSPRQLRAIRRMSIHRIFQVLDRKYKPSGGLQEFVKTILKRFELSVVSLNWDVVWEKEMTKNACPFHFGIEVSDVVSQSPQIEGIPILKMHGSSNWLYCDSCRRIYTGDEGNTKKALHSRAFLETADFGLFDVKHRLRGEEKSYIETAQIMCPRCSVKLAGRIATFSYRKAFTINQFQTIWDDAFDALSNAKYWLFIGYSMPQADFEFRHLLKSTELARGVVPLTDVQAVLLDDHEGEQRFRTYFGSKVSAVHQEGLSDWVHQQMPNYVND